MPGSADRIINRFEKQSDHRMQLESLAIRGDDRRANRGQWFAFLLALVGILASTYIIVSGHSVAGTILFGGTLLELVTTFIYGAETRRRERQQKNRRLQE